jgi:hypothetical protein
MSCFACFSSTSTPVKRIEPCIAEASYKGSISHHYADISENETPDPWESRDNPKKPFSARVSMGGKEVDVKLENIAQKKFQEPAIR